MKGHHTLGELTSQPEAWERALAALATAAPALRGMLPAFDEVILTGCGSTYYLALAAATTLRERGVDARGLPASEIWLYPRSAYRAERKTLLVAVSRSGTTTETLRAVEGFKAHARGAVLTLSCYPDRPLAGLGDVNLVLEAGQEESVAQTRAFSVLYLATVALALLGTEPAAAGGDLEALAPLPDAGRRLLERYRPLASRLGSDPDLDRFYFLGSGPRYGLACETSLKLKEMSLSHSEPFHFLEFRHGPQAMLTDTTLLIGLVSDTNAASERAVLDEMAERGARVLALAERSADATLESGMPETLRNVLYLPVLQLLAYERSLWKGLDPDRPHNLDAVVVLDG